MFALEPILRNRLAACPGLQGFAVRSATDEESSKRTFPAVELACEGARLEASNGASVKVAVAWGAHLIVARSRYAAAELDAAFAAVISELLNYAPGAVDGRSWSALKLVPGGTAVQVPEFVEQGLAEYAVIFETTAVYHGQQ